MDVQSLLTKYNDEMQIVDRIPEAQKKYFKAQYVWNTPITNKENFLTFVRGEKPMFMPMPRHAVSFGPAVIPDTVARHSIMEVAPQPDEPLTVPDMFGVDWTYVPVTGGSMVRPGDPQVPDLEHWRDYVTIPDPDTWDWEESFERNSVYKTDLFARKIIFYSTLFERLISWMDFEDAAVALIDDDEKPFVHDALNGINDVYEKIIPRFKEGYGVDVIYAHDDWGTQQNSFFSEDAAMEMLLPHVKRLVQISHDSGLLYEQHSCGCHGAVTSPMMIAAGVDTWRPQPMNDSDMLFDKYGDKLRYQFTIEPPGPEAEDQFVFDYCVDFVTRFMTPDKWACPYYYVANPHPLFYPAMYAVSREYLATH